MRRRLHILALFLAFLPGEAAAFEASRSCEAVAALSCRLGEGCHPRTPDIASVTIAGLASGRARIGYCQGDVCFEGLLEQHLEGSPEYKAMGTVIAERLPLKRSYHGAFAFFAAFDVNDDTLVLSALGPSGQTTTWLACERREP